MRNVLVTGGSRGLGLAIAVALADAGYRAIAVARTQSDPLKAAQQARSAGTSGEICFDPFDLAEIEAIPEFVKRLRKTHGPLYGLVNNAGVSVESMLSAFSQQDVERVVRINTVAPIILTKHVVRQMLAAGEGRIVNMSSIVASTGYAGLSVYAATKASMTGFTRSLAREVGAAGITVNAVAPGFVDTELTSGLSAHDRQTVARRAALKRMPDTGDVAGAVLYLMSDSARNVTGTVLTVDAGATA